MGFHPILSAVLVVVEAVLLLLIIFKFYPISKYLSEVLAFVSLLSLRSFVSFIVDVLSNIYGVAKRILLTYLTAFATGKIIKAVTGKPTSAALLAVELVISGTLAATATYYTYKYIHAAGDIIKRVSLLKDIVDPENIFYHVLIKGEIKYDTKRHIKLMIYEMLLLKERSKIEKGCISARIDTLEYLRGNISSPEFYSIEVQNISVDEIIDYIERVHNGKEPEVRIVEIPLLSTPNAIINKSTKYFEYPRFIEACLVSEKPYSSEAFFDKDFIRYFGSELGTVPPDIVINASDNVTWNDQIFVKLGNATIYLPVLYIMIYGNLTSEDKTEFFYIIPPYSENLNVFPRIRAAEKRTLVVNISVESNNEKFYEIPITVPSPVTIEIANCDKVIAYKDVDVNISGNIIPIRVALCEHTVGYGVGWSSIKEKYKVVVGQIAELLSHPECYTLSEMYPPSLSIPSPEPYYISNTVIIANLPTASKERKIRIFRLVPNSTEECRNVVGPLRMWIQSISNKPYVIELRIWYQKLPIECRARRPVRLKLTSGGTLWCVAREG